jgi:branched-chain amino acid transport system substrate-binding protein
MKGPSVLLRRWFLVLTVAVALGAFRVVPVSAADDTIPVGVILPLTGALAQTGASLRAGAELAADLVNGHVSYPLPAVGKSGIPSLHHARIRLVIADSQGKNDQAASVAQQLITQDHVVAILGAYASSNTATASQVAERAGIPFVCEDSTASNLTTRGYKWFFRPTPHDGTFAQNLIDFMGDLKKKNNAAIKKIAIVHEDGLFGTGSADAESADATRAGYDVVANIAYSATTTDVSAEVQKIKVAAPDVLMITSYLPDSLLFMRALKDQDVPLKAIVAQDAGFIDPNFLKTMGSNAEGVFTREVFSLNIKNRNLAVPLIDQLYRARFGGKPLDGNSAREIMGVLVLADALGRAASTAPDAIRVALTKTNIPGERTLMPWKNIQFGPDGQNGGGAGIVEQVQGGEYQTVWPFDVAVKPVVWPMPAWKR